jgi:hypothetical protein
VCKKYWPWIRLDSAKGKQRAVARVTVVSHHKTAAVHQDVSTEGLRAALQHNQQNTSSRPFISPDRQYIGISFLACLVDAMPQI